MTTPETSKMIERVSLLLAQADHPNTSPVEAEAYRAKAEVLMQKYRIDEEVARQSNKAQGVAAMPTQIDISICATDSAYRSDYYGLFYWIADHVGVRHINSYKTIVDSETGFRTRVLTATVVGFDSDLRLLEMIYTSVRMHFGSVLEPKADSSLSDQVNIYNLRNSGMERNRIAAMIWGSAMDDGSAHGKVARLYKAECTLRGEDAKVSGRSVNAKSYRESFGSYYVDEIRTRLHRMAAAAGTDSGAIVLHGRKEDVNEEFYRLFPDMRPSTEVYTYTPCAKCAANKSNTCREHPAGRSSSSRAVSAAGASAGRSAARTASLDGASPTPRGRVSQPSTRSIG